MVRHAALSALPCCFRTRRGALKMAAALAAVAALLPAAVAAAPGDVGYQGPSYTGASASPSGSKPESKLWWNDGSWWASMFDTVSKTYHIFELDLDTQTWRDTGVPIDPRTTTRADVLWDGVHLYVASHRFTESTPSSGYPSRLYRYRYDAAARTYVLDTGFPVAINDYRTETLVIDKDSTGRLWATWVQANTVYVNRTMGDDRTWGTPFALPLSAASVSADDISSLVAFDGKVGVIWSNQNADAFYFAVHADGAPDTAWDVRAAWQGPSVADDHVSLAADSSGRVFAAVKTALDELTDRDAPLVALLVRDPATGDWARHTVGRVRDAHTRPVVVLDADGNVHVLATARCCSGTIYEKTSPADAIAFPVGAGTPFIHDAANPTVNNATTTKQTVGSASGLVALATNDATSRYWHNHQALAPPAVPVADFSGAPTSGAAPLAVAFSDRSTGEPTAWSWDFGDGSGSTAKNPTHTYATPGLYTVTLTVSNGSGSDTETKVDYVSVGVGAVVFTAAADAYVKSSSPTKNTGAETTLRLKAPTDTYPTDYRAFVKFNVSGLGGTVVEAKLRLYVADAAPDGGSAYSVSSDWTELGLTWQNKPALTGAPVGSAGAAVLGTWVEIDVTPAITGNGTYSFGLTTSSANFLYYSSRETANAPQLVVTQR